jgi:hypothetical protein
MLALMLAMMSSIGCFMVGHFFKPFEGEREGKS